MIAFLFYVENVCMQKIYNSGENSMKLMEASIECLKENMQNKKVIAFSASDFLKMIAKNYAELELEKNISYIVDNDISKQGIEFDVCGIKKRVCNPNIIKKEKNENIVIIISSDVYVYEIYEQLNEMIKDSDVPVFALSLVISKNIDDKTNKSMFAVEKHQIPKIIHYFWFSGEEKDEMTNKCINSWKKCCSDYEIVEWNSHNYDVTKNEFAYEAFKNRKWAYVSDFARLDVIYEYGGIYLDTDVRLFQSLDCLLGNDMFMAFGPLREIEAATIGACKHNELIKKMLGLYFGKKFDANRTLGLLDVQPFLLENVVQTEGFCIDGKYQIINGNALFPRDLFSGKNWFTGEYEYGEIALGVHECAGNWAKGNRRQTKRNQNKAIEKIYNTMVIG